MTESGIGNTKCCQCNSEASGKSTGTLKPRWFECEAALLPPQGDLLENQLMEVNMRVEKRVLNDALRVLGKGVCQTSPVELYRSVRFVGDVDGVMAIATNETC